MKTIKSIFRTTLLCSLLIIAACSSDDDASVPPAPQGDFDFGTLVLNEGGIGSVTYISEDFDRVDQQIYQSVNPGEELGAFAQHMFFDDSDRAFIIGGGSNLITVVNRFTFEKLGEITTGLDNPRYGVVEGGNIYVTNQASFMTNDDDYVAIYNADSFAPSTPLVIGKPVEFIISDGSKLYVQNAAFGFGSGITVIDPNTNSVETEIPTGAALQGIKINASTMYALHASGMDVISLSSQTVTSTINLPSDISGATNLDIFNGRFYYTFGASVYSSELAASTLSNTPIITYESQSQFGTMYGFEVNDGFIYISDATDFVSDGFVEIYDLDGNLVFSTSTGVGPNGFYFN
jgi:YVTN family beta-propeller protein